jgi:4-amino-4-deoxychorismate lyase
MSRLIESIRLEDGVFQRPNYHQQRVNDALNHFYPGIRIDLVLHLDKSDFPGKGLYKCRVVYDSRVDKIEFEPYIIRPASSLKLVSRPDISYPFKLEDRTELIKAFAQREQCDDVLIIKGEMVTDTSYSNIAFRKGKEWITPQSCLLKGTMRQYLLDKKIIREEQVSVKDLPKYEQFRLINAMLGWESPAMNISNII